ncbi:coiled-coil domain-containing protein 171-like [Molothrus aeneus]|uniref:coiled-coil domain-containing protein 171-like n=1 Tax=Molothrus aeneus TaxID=84833 RepID=UPI00345AB2C1
MRMSPQPLDSSGRRQRAAGARRSPALGSGHCDISPRIQAAAEFPSRAPPWSLEFLRQSQLVMLEGEHRRDSSRNALQTLRLTNKAKHVSARGLDSLMMQKRLIFEAHQVEVCMVNCVLHPPQFIDLRKPQFGNHEFSPFRQHRFQGTYPMSCYEKEIKKLRLELEKGEALRQHLESEMTFASKEADLRLYAAEDELCDAKAKVMELQEMNDEHQQKASETEKIVQRFAVEMENIHRVHLAELEFLFKEKAEAEMAFQKTNAALQSIAKKLKDLEAEHSGCTKVLKLQAACVEIKNKRQERLLKELEAAAVKIKKLEDDAAAARRAHVECKYTTEVMQLRIQELEDILNEGHRGRREDFPEGIAREEFREPVNALETGKKDSQGQRLSSGVQWKDQAEEGKRAQDANATLVAPPDSFSLQEGSIREMSILLNTYQTLANAQVLSRPTNVPLEELPWTELCALLHENVEALVSNFSKANQRIYYLKECQSCALLSGALCSLYSRLCATSCQRDILQEQVNQKQLLNHKIVSLLYALPAVVERNQDEGRLRQRRAKNLVYVFRRAVIAVLAANRLRALARYSCFGEEGVDCIEALHWLTSSNLYTAIISSISELESVLSKQDAQSWLFGHSFISAARNCFAQLMDNLSVLMETVQGNARGCRAYLERDSLTQRLPRGLQTVNAQALETGLYDRLPSTRNIAILQQEVFGFLQRLHAAEVESHSLHLQLAECRWAFNKMQKDAEKACRLQEQLNELQRRINQDNVQEELDNAVQHEHEAQLLLQEHQRRVQELSNTLELHSCTNKDRSQVSNVPLMSLSNATEELRRRDQVLDHQNRLLKDPEQDQQRLQETLQEAERAIQQGAM